MCLCKCLDSPRWSLGVDLKPQHSDHDIASSDWLCLQCHKAFSLPPSRLGTSKFEKDRSEVLSMTVEIIKDNIGCLVSEILNMHKKVLPKLMISRNLI